MYTARAGRYPGGQQIQREDVDREDVSMALEGGDTSSIGVDGGIVDHGVDPTDRVDLVGDAACVARAGEVADHHARCAAGEVLDACGSFPGAGVEHDLVAAVEQFSCGTQAEACRRAGDQDACHQSARVPDVRERHALVNTGNVLDSP
jgi:hypothetical protein